MDDTKITPKKEGGKASLPKVLKVEEEYDVIPGEAVAASRAIVDVHERLGRPDTPLSDAGSKVMDVIVSVWEDLYPDQRKRRWNEIKKYRKNEISNRQKVKKKTGRNLASIPTPVYSMMRKVFPNFKMDNREDFMKLVRKYPYFQVTEKR